MSYPVFFDLKSHPVRFVPARLIICTLIWLALLLVCFKSEWSRELCISSGDTVLIGEKAGFMFLFFIFSFVISVVFEWVFHRYPFHLVQNPLRYKHHVVHHGSHDAAHNYATLDVKQAHGAAFPLWALPGFWLTYSLPVVPLQLFVLRDIPILLPTLLAVAAGYFLYEDFHFKDHKPPGWWIDRLNNKRWGKMYEKLYVFHYLHHLHPSVNMAVFGRLLGSFPDLWFGTFLKGYVLRDETTGRVIPENGKPKVVHVPMRKPVKPVAALDAWIMRRWPISD